jgi:uncharacterized protein DUF6210
MKHGYATGGKRLVVLDPNGCGADLGWMFVIVAAPTGVVYLNQSGGYSCAQYEQEGYLIPLLGAGLDEELKEIFVGELRGWGTRGLTWPVELLDRLRTAVASFAVYACDRHDDLYPTPLVLDESRLDEVAEAWLPVVTPDGPGVLVWENSD